MLFIHSPIRVRIQWIRMYTVDYDFDIITNHNAVFLDYLFSSGPLNGDFVISIFCLCEAHSHNHDGMYICNVNQCDGGREKNIIYYFDDLFWTTIASL